MNDPYDNGTYPAYYDYGYDEFGDPCVPDDYGHDIWDDNDLYAYESPYADEIEPSYDAY